MLLDSSVRRAADGVELADWQAAATAAESEPDPVF